MSRRLVLIAVTIALIVCSAAGAPASNVIVRAAVRAAVTAIPTSAPTPIPTSTPGTSWNERVLYRFAPQGVVLYSGILRTRKGRLYGTTANGGAFGAGSVFRLDTPAHPGGPWTQTTLHAFTNANGDGRHPIGDLIEDRAEALYGTTFFGGNVASCGRSAGCGIVFKLEPPRPGATEWTETILHTFAKGDGAAPSGRLTMDARGALYGVTVSGGAHGVGTVFRLNPPVNGAGAWTETVLHSFGATPVDGRFPRSSLVWGPDGALYGTTGGGGNSTTCAGSGCGTVFRIAPTRNAGAWVETTLYSFTQGGGAFPKSGVIFDNTGALFGTTSATGVGTAGNATCTLGCGLVYKLTQTPSGWTETVLHAFNGLGVDGATPWAGLTADGYGNLYGTTLAGGQSQSGTVFMLQRPSPGESTWASTTLYSFGPPFSIPRSATGSDAGHPYAGVTFFNDSTLVGTGMYGDGACTFKGECGALFSLQPPSATNR